MKIVGLTGGIATGKSTAVKMLQNLLGGRMVLFDADVCVAQIYRSKEALDDLVKLMDDARLVDGGRLVRERLRQRVAQSESDRKRLEGWIHPLVREECLAKLEAAQQSSEASLFLADVPLLFEGGFHFGQTLHMVVALSTETQRKRLKERSGWDDETITAILEAQLPICEKIKRADHVFWNEGSRELLEQQLARWITTFLSV